MQVGVNVLCEAGVRLERNWAVSYGSGSGRVSYPSCEQLSTLHCISVLSQGEPLHGRDDSRLADADRRGRGPDSAVVSVSRNDPPRVRLLPRENAFP
jgi:hypothetical protein